MKKEVHKNGSRKSNKTQCLQTAVSRKFYVKTFSDLICATLNMPQITQDINIYSAFFHNPVHF